MERRAFIGGTAMMWWFGSQRVGAATVGPEVPPQTGVYYANDPLISYSDCVAPNFVSGFMQFRRPIADDPIYNFQYAMPGARQRFRSNAPSVTIKLRWNGLVSNLRVRNLIGHVFVDGSFQTDFQTPSPVNAVVISTITINMGSSADRLYEIVLPYSDGVEFGEVQVSPPYVVTAAAARTGSLIACYGDSITQGFYSTDVRRSWPFMLAQTKGFRCINMGYGGRKVVPSDGTALASLNPDLITVLIGANNYLEQTPVANYSSDLSSLLQNIHTVNPNVPVYVAQPLDCGTSLTIPMSSYQAVPGSVISSLGYSQLHLVSKSTLITNFATQMDADGVHPNQAGVNQMATGWASAIP